MRARTALLALAAAVGAAACAARQPHSAERASALSRPEPDPACRNAVQGCLALNGLEQVVVEVAVARDGTPAVVRVLTPALTPVAAVEVRRAFESCLWKPAVGPDGARIDGSVTLAVRR